MKRYKLSTLIAILILLLAIFPLSSIIGSYWLSFMTLSVIYIIVASWLRVIMRVGQVSFAQAAFMGIGAYSSTLLSINLDFPFWVAFLSSGIIVAVCALAIGFITLRLKGVYFFLASFATGEIVLLVFAYWKDLFGGHLGITNIPSPSIFLSPFGSYYLAALLAAATVILIYLWENSKLGLTSWAIRENQLLSESVGINIMKYQLLTFVIACFLTGLTGSVYAHFMRFISPSSFTFSQMLSLLVWVVVGGLNHFIGPITGVIILRGIAEVFGGLREYEMILNSLILVLVILFLPDGLYSIPLRFKMVFSALGNFFKGNH